MGLLISFSGFDGVGKSTQIKLLSKYLKRKGERVYVTEEMFGYFLLKPLIKALRTATGSLPAGPVKKNKEFLPKLWFIVAFIDIWIMYISRIRPRMDRYNFVIADRFYTDIWANLLYYGYLPNWALIIVKLLPKPDIAILLYVRPEVVLSRETEFPTSYYKYQAKIYKRLADQINFNVIDASQGTKAVFKKIKILLDSSLHD